MDLSNYIDWWEDSSIASLHEKTVVELDVEFFDKVVAVHNNINRQRRLIGKGDRTKDTRSSDSETLKDQSHFLSTKDS